jgi:hypothetical protein
MGSLGYTNLKVNENDKIIEECKVCNISVECN